MTENKVAVDVFQDSKNDPASRVNQEAPEINQQPADRSEAKPTETKQQENTTNTTQVIAQDDNAAMQNTLSISLPWIAAGVVAIVILLALFNISRKIGERKR